MSAWERGLLELLLSADFPGHEIYAQQLNGSKVREMDEEDQLEFSVQRDAPLASDDIAKQNALVEAHYFDEDGRDVALILHARDGKLRMLEKYKSWITPISNSEPDLTTLLPVVL